jgi:error-prone DNA polymerase
MRYLEFAVASNFSFLRGASHPEELMVQAAHIGLAGLGLCDRNSVAGVVRAHLAKHEQNLSLRYHPGARLVFADGTPDVLVYPRDRAGWGRLTRLLTVGNLRAEKGDCILHLDDLLAHAFGLELIAMAGDARLLARLREAAPHRVRLAASMLYRGRDRAQLARMKGLARVASVPLIAVNDVFYHHPHRRPLADVLTCIREKTTIDRAGRKLAANAERYLKPSQEMKRLFRDAPEAIEETLRLSDALSFSLDELRYEYPDEQVEGFSNAQDALAHLTYEGAAHRYPQGLSDKVRATHPISSPSMTSCASRAHKIFFARVAARPPIPRSVTASASPRSAPTAPTCCSSALFLPSGASHLTLTSILSTSGAKRSFNTSTANMDANARASPPP